MPNKKQKLNWGPWLMNIVISVFVAGLFWSFSSSQVSNLKTKFLTSVGLLREDVKKIGYNDCSNLQNWYINENNFIVKKDGQVRLRYLEDTFGDRITYRGGKIRETEIEPKQVTLEVRPKINNDNFYVLLEERSNDISIPFLRVDLEGKTLVKLTDAVGKLTKMEFGKKPADNALYSFKLVIVKDENVFNTLVSIKHADQKGDTPILVGSENIKISAEENVFSKLNISLGVIRNKGEQNTNNVIGFDLIDCLIK